MFILVDKLLMKYQYKISIKSYTCNCSKYINIYNHYQNLKNN